MKFCGSVQGRIPERRGAMKLCINCKYCVDDGSWIGKRLPFDIRWEPYYTCTSPNADKLRYPITGEWPPCEKMRLNEKYCGKSGKWFEPKDS